MNDTLNIKRVTLSAKEYAAIMRKELKAAFPGVKFSCAMCSSGGVVNINYTDGPRKEDVEAIALKYGRAGFDGMTDCGYQNDSMILTEDGPVKYTVYAYIYVYRAFSITAKDNAQKTLDAGWRPKHSLVVEYKRYDYLTGETDNVGALLDATDFTKAAK